MKKILLRVLSVAILISIFLFLGSGCLFQMSKEQKIDYMLDHLKSKYNQEFEAGSFSESGFAYHYDALSAYPKGKKELTFDVEGDKNKEGKYICRDNYFQYIIRDEYEKVMSDIVKEYFSDFKIYMNKSEGMCADSLNYGTKVSEIYSKDKSFHTDLIMYVKQNNLNNKNLDVILDEIGTKMVEIKLVTQLRTAIIIDNEFNNVIRENIPLLFKNYNNWWVADKSVHVYGNLDKEIRNNNPNK